MITRNNVLTALAALATATLSSCSSAPTKEATINADYGLDMSSAQCISATEPVIAYGLKDPGSAQFRHGACIKDHWNSIPIMRMGIEFGWIQRGEVNAKNSFGAYVGFQPYKVLIKNGQAVRWCINDDIGACIPAGR